MEHREHEQKGGEGAIAAFYRVEGTLLRRPSLAAAAYFAANAQGVPERFARLSGVALAAPFALLGQRLGASEAPTRATWMAVRDMSEDRLTVLAEEYYERFLSPSILEVGRGLLATSKKRGHRVVLLSDNIDLLMRPLGHELGADELVCNRLEVRDGSATGRLADPVMGGQVSGQWARAYAAREGLSLERSAAYGANGADTLLLSAIGQPCVVNPDPWLRRVAREQSWPVVDA